VISSLPMKLPTHVVFGSFLFFASVAAAADRHPKPTSLDISSEAAETLVLDPTELQQKLESVINSDPRHVYPLLLAMPDNSKSPLVLVDNSTYVTIPARLSRGQAKQIVSFAFSEDGQYRGFNEFWDGFTHFLQDTRLHESEARIVTVDVARVDGEMPDIVRMVTTEHQVACDLNRATEQWQGSESHSHVTQVEFNSLEIVPFANPQPSP